MIGFKIDFLWYEIGSSDFLYSFFSTVGALLEKNSWGSRFPVVMNELFSGTLNWRSAENALKEISEIRKELKKFKPKQIVWNFEDRTLTPPWTSISKSIKNLSSYFVTSDGRDLFDVIIDSLNSAIELEFDLSLHTL